MIVIRFLRSPRVRHAALGIARGARVILSIVSGPSGIAGLVNGRGAVASQDALTSR